MGALLLLRRVRRRLTAVVGRERAKTGEAPPPPAKAAPPEPKPRPGPPGAAG